MFNSSYIEQLNKKNKMFVHIINADFFFVQVRNIINQSIIINRNEKLNILTEYKKKTIT